MAKRKRPTDDQYRESAWRQFNSEGEIEVDRHTAILSKDPKNPNKGCYVLAWVWVHDADAREV